MTESDPFPRVGETVHSIIEAVGVRLSISDQRLLVTQPDSGRILLDMPIDDLRRIQFDIERSRPATLVIVPEHTLHDAQVLGIGPESYDAASIGLGYVGGLLHGLPDPV